MDWKGKRVTVMGLGLLGGGVGSAAYAARHGAHVTVTDLKDASALTESMQKLVGLPIRYVLSGHREDDFRTADLIIRNPAVPDGSPFLALAHKKNISVESDASIFFTSTSAFLIGVTGTKGKSTTATLIFHGLSALRIPVELSGTPDTSLFTTLERIESQRTPPIIVVELSSWDLESIAPHKMSPSVAVITNFFPDHLNRHGTLTAYRDAKATIFRFQQPGDVCIFPEHDRDLWSGLAAMGNTLLVGDEERNKLPTLKLPGEHNRTNAALALAAIRAAIGHPKFPQHCRPIHAQPQRAVTAIASFQGLPGRFEALPSHNGRHIINDTASTNPGATLAALQALSGPIVLIAGGEDKALPVTELCAAIAQHVTYLVLLPGSASEKIRTCLASSAFTAVDAASRSMDDAVTAAFRVSKPGDTILLSPAAASFNLFMNEFDRGAQFLRAIAQQPHAEKATA